MNANQLVAYNLRRLREDHGLTQERVALTLSGWRGGKPWTSSSFSVAEQSVNDGSRKREFDANELLALALTFNTQVGELFRSPPDVDGVFCGDPSDGARLVSRLALEDAAAPTNWEENPLMAIEKAVVRLKRIERGRSVLRPKEEDESDA
jgi:transcriptional regulator with XRE-family HTH domain